MSVESNEQRLAELLAQQKATESKIDRLKEEMQSQSQSTNADLKLRRESPVNSGQNDNSFSDELAKPLQKQGRKGLSKEGELIFVILNAAYLVTLMSIPLFMGCPRYSGPLCEQGMGVLKWLLMACVGGSVGYVASKSVLYGTCCSVSCLSAISLGVFCGDPTSDSTVLILCIGSWVGFFLAIFHFMEVSLLSGTLFSTATISIYLVVVRVYLSWQ